MLITGHNLGISLTVAVSDATVDTVDLAGEASSNSVQTGGNWKIVEVATQAVADRADAVTKLQA